MAAKQLTSALRYCGIIPADKVGLTCLLSNQLLRGHIPALMIMGGFKGQHHPCTASQQTGQTMQFLVKILDFFPRHCLSRVPGHLPGRHGLRVSDRVSGLRMSDRVFVGHVSPPQAFLEAGLAWREAGLPSMAFVMLNRFLDLCDAMDEPDSTTAVRHFL